MVAGCGLDQLSGDVDLVASRVDAAFEDIFDAELAADIAHIDGLALVDVGRIAGDDEEIP
jgi:hypothetical protein